MARIRKRDLFKVFLRSFFIQATWNSERLLGLGFCFCLIPIAKRLYKDKQKQIAFLKRHIGFFNSHPYMANYALGAVSNIEQQAILKNWEDNKPVEVFKNRVIGPLGAIGDTLFWQLLLPSMAILGVILSFSFGQWGALIFLILFNTVHIYLRSRGLINGFLKGFDIIRDLSLRGTKKYFKIFKSTISLLLGAEIVYMIFRTVDFEETLKGTVVFIISMIFAFFITRTRKLSVDLMIIIGILGSLIIGLIA
ncbi:PTS system mannose/fructose/sorbose family transporter subunit IID [candidate division KSB1 bacterium]|nr:PTS system mannose/fructose/sorbose family transporter subunit IID [candidate division KSB1 bacterium]MBL7093882.1 PTS system mannose/fructose/sorbose family transporter subunit IID [candidate division KSB1 bacterium]